MSRLTELSYKIELAVKELTHAWRGEPNPATIAALKQVAHELHEMDGAPANPEVEAVMEPATEGEEQTG